MEQLNQRNLDGVVAEYTADATFHGWSPQSLDVDGYYTYMSALFAVFPDSRFPAWDVVAEGDKVVVRHQFGGTHRGAFQGIAPTGKRVAINGIVIFRHNEDGQIAAGWLNADIMGLMQQLGVVPTPGQV